MIPDILNMKVKQPLVDTMTIDTSILDPIVSSSSFCRFTFERKGVLDIGSRIQFSINPDAAADNKAFLPLKTGAYCAVKRAVFKIGTKTISSIEDFPYYQTMKVSGLTGEESSGRNQPHTSIASVLCPDNQDLGKYQVRDCDYQDEGTQLAGKVISQFKLINDESTCPLFSIKLSMLFPFMDGLALPLFLIDEPVSIEISWNTQKDTEKGILCCFEQGYGGNTACSIGSSNVKLLADYIFHSDGKMSELANDSRGQGLVLPYRDIILTTSNIPATAQPTAGSPVKQTVSKDIGVSGRNVHNILLHSQNTTEVDDLLGVYTSRANDIPESYNFKVNDKLVYNRDVSLESHKAEEFSKALGTPIQCTNAEYSYDAISNKQDPDYTKNNNLVSSTVLLEGHAQQDSLQGSSHFIGCDLSNLGNSTKVKNKPITHTLTLTRTAADYQQKTLRHYTEVERVMSLKNGMVMVSA